MKAPRRQRPLLPPRFPLLENERYDDRIDFGLLRPATHHGVVLGSIYGLIAIGYTMVYGSWR